MTVFCGEPSATPNIPGLYREMPTDYKEWLRRRLPRVSRAAAYNEEREPAFRSLRHMSEQPTACRLADRTCVPCRAGATPLKGEALQELARQVPEWEVVGEHHLRRVWRWKNFVEALAFVNRVGAVAEELGHHPVIELSWGRTVVSLHTHRIDGLTENDFILAARIDKIAG